MYKALDLWLPAYLCRRSSPKPTGTRHILLAICDHFEPLHGVDKSTALERIRRWKREYPKLIEPYPDADQRRPRHTFFYPVEQYDTDIVAELTELCHLCGCEVELHLHHDRDTEAGLRDKLERGKENLARHNLLARDPAGKVRYGFIHGNWALDDSHPGGRHCGVPTELRVLADTGCFADFTMPSAPDRTQTRIINSIYYAYDTPKPKSHDFGVLARVEQDSPPQLLEEGADCPADGHTLPRNKGVASSEALLLVQGPLGLNWRQRKCGFLPRIENGELTASNPPTRERMRLWVQLDIHVQGRPEWIFIKLHTHGGIPQNYNVFFGDLMRRFYEHALVEYNDGRAYCLHFVTAREMVNIIHAAESGHAGNAGQFRDFRYLSLLVRGKPRLSPKL